MGDVFSNVLTKMKSICDTFFAGYLIDENAAASLLSCFFKPALTKKCFRIIALNPMNFQEPIRKIGFLVWIDCYEFAFQKIVLHGNILIFAEQPNKRTNEVEV